MATRSTKIIILLVVDVLFFLIELIVGYSVGSLSLIADSFHMLNDVMSLVVALYAIKLSGKTASTSLSYGWHRAEILAALINGVFLLALCFSIFMEAIERFFSVVEISNPALVVVVGCCGLASNILGLFLFHEHGHGHSHDNEDSGGHSHSHDASPLPKAATLAAAAANGEREPLLMNRSTTPPMNPSVLSMSPSGRQRTGSIDSISLFGHPIQNRAKVIATAQEIATSYGRASSPPPSPIHMRSSSRQRSSASLVNDTVVLEEDEDEDEPEGTTTPHAPVHRHSSGARSHSHGRRPSAPAEMERGRKEAHHHHGNMNMRALLLHVLGDALGNVGVIASGLIIWQTTWSWRYYSDPMISLLITVIIFSSALPLVKSASYILLQGVPEDIKLDDLRSDIANVEGVVSVHELHVWQLSETRHIASVHIRLDKKADYMRVVVDIRKILHKCDIHNATIQPEFGDMPSLSNGDQMGSCLVACPADICAADQICCPPPETAHNHEG